MLRHVLSTSQFLDPSLLGELFTRADELRKEKNNDALKGKILASVFYEPSTRTRFSFEAAMYRLGGKVISTENAEEFSSAIKGETLEDSIRVISGYADAIVLRHHEKGACKRAASVSSVPIINAGDGPGEHPTQALLDLYTLQKELGGVNGKKVAFVGDLKYGRTVHSFSQLLSLYDVELFLVSPPQLQMPGEYRQILTLSGTKFIETRSLDEVLPVADAVYATRIQRERFDNAEEYQKVKDAFVITKREVEKMKRGAILMHPLPRVNEITQDVDDDKRAVYFKQAENGLYVRMALLEKILKE